MDVESVTEICNASHAFGKPKNEHRIYTSDYTNMGRLWTH